MEETPEDIERLEALLARSYVNSGTHLRDIHATQKRLTAPELVDRLSGMNVLVVATVSADGRPFTGPVDSLFYRGRLHFGTSTSALRSRHLERAPVISATHVREESLVVTVHGTARKLDLSGPDHAFADVCRDHYGAGWDDWGRVEPHWSIEPDKMFAADMTR